VKIVADRNIPGIAETFANHGDVVLVDGRTIARAHVLDAQALIVRSVSAVGPDLLAGTRVEFVGSATIGTDHLDTAWLDAREIHWVNAPGCNADAAAQYTLAMILLACQRLDIEPGNCKIGVVGFGNVGSRVHRLLSVMGVNELRVCDPPLALAGKGAREMVFHPMESMTACDILTLHVPLTNRGAHPTVGLIDGDFLNSLSRGSLLVNSSRGKVIDGAALLAWLSSESGYAALDVFPNEPDIQPELIEHCTVVTPHVAGYSLDGRINGTAMIYREFCNWYGLNPDSTGLSDRLPAENLGLNGLETLTDIVLHACPVQRDDAQLRQTLSAAASQRTREFDRLRTEYPARRDFGGWSLGGVVTGELRKKLDLLGFH
jgi:erythronate-4-phosphate dehydrogenase